MNLKTNYKNDKFAGLRKYKMTEDHEGLVTLEDKTNYTEVGDIFSAEDINATNKAVLENNVDIILMKGIKRIVIPASGWSDKAPYVQSVSALGAQENISLIIGGPYLGDEPGIETVRARKKAFGYVDRVVSGNGIVTLYCYGSKPAVDFEILVKGSGE